MIAVRAFLVALFVGWIWPAFAQVAVPQLTGRVVDQTGVDRGACVSVIDNPANDLLELDTGHLVPVTFVESVVDGVITVDTPDGLFDLLD